MLAAMGRSAVKPEASKEEGQLPRGAQGKYVSRSAAGKNDAASLPPPAVEDDEPPDFLTCPLTFEVMHDPVITADGHTFERSAIEDWLRNHSTNPMTGSEMQHKQLVPNFALREACAAYRAQKPGNTDSIRRYEEAVAKLPSTAPGPAAQTDPSGHDTCTMGEGSDSGIKYASPHRPSISVSNTAFPAFPDVDSPSEELSSSAPAAHQGPDSHRQLHISSAPVPSSSSPPPSQCSLCPSQATSKQSIGGEWIMVCNSCSALVESQRRQGGRASRATSLRSLSAAEAAQQALSTVGSVSTTFGGSETGMIQPHRISGDAAGVTSAAGGLPCAHCRRDGIPCEVVTVDSVPTMLCRACRETHDQFLGHRLNSETVRRTEEQALARAERQSALQVGVATPMVTRTDYLRASRRDDAPQEHPLARRESQEWRNVDQHSANRLADELNMKYQYQ